MKFLMSKENFIKIYYDENRKGNPLEYRFTSEMGRIKTLSKNIKKADKQEKNRLSKEKFEALEELFLDIANQIADIDTNITKKSRANKKDIYCYKDSLGAYLIDKQIQNNLQLAFKIRMNSHKKIVTQMIYLLEDKIPKYIYRTDIKSFFETIPHSHLKKEILKNNRLDAFTRDKIINILRQYSVITNNDCGIPRGIGLSSYLAEIYMKRFDYIIHDNDDVFFYSRFVDDIVIFSTKDISAIIDERVEKISLQCNSDKTILLKPYEKQRSFEYLGYSFQIDNNLGLKIGISDKRKRKIEQRISRTIEDYNINARKSEAKSWKLLNERLRFLTGNTRLAGIKNNIFTGIYYSNPLINDSKALENLDELLKEKLREINFPDKISINKEKSRKKLEEYSFEEGFKEKKFYIFNSNQIAKITKIWRNLDV